MTRQETIYREKYYICGEYLDVYVYPVYKRPGQRSAKAKPTTATQAKLNAKKAAEKIVRKMHANFTPEDISAGLDYAVNPEDDDRAKKDIHNFLDRVRRRRKKLGLPPLKYITVTEKSGKGRYHHHIIINGGIDRDEIEELWGLGRANADRLQFSENGLAGLGHYIVKNPIFSKRWNASRNLVDPEPRTNDSRIRSRRKAAELARDPEDRAPWEKLYPDYHLAEVVPFHNDSDEIIIDANGKPTVHKGNGGIYIFARLYRKDKKFIAPARGGRRRE